MKYPLYVTTNLKLKFIHSIFNDKTQVLKKLMGKKVNSPNYKSYGVPHGTVKEQIFF